MSEENLCCCLGNLYLCPGYVQMEISPGTRRKRNQLTLGQFCTIQTGLEENPHADKLSLAKDQMHL